MTETSRTSKTGYRLVGGLLLAGGIAAVFLIDSPQPQTEEPLLVRPLKTMVIASDSIFSAAEYPGRVLAGQKVDLAFEVSGTILEFPVKSGDRVKTDQVLARLDPRDYENNLRAAQAEQQRAQSFLERVQKAAEMNAVSQQELSNAEAGARAATAQVKIRQKALDDTYLRARFDGIVANTFVDNFANIQSKQPILSLQDISQADIELFVPQSRVAMADKKKFERGEMNVNLFAVFSFGAGHEYPVRLKEFSAEADPLTQTYRGVVTMPSPDDVNLLPGMTATIRIVPKDSARPATTAFEVPLDAVPVDGLGQYYVWLVKDSGEGNLAVTRQDVTVGALNGDNILITDGLNDGDRIALAGVTVLREGQAVRLLDADLSAAP